MTLIRPIVAPMVARVVGPLSASVGAVDPYAGALAAYDFRSASNYTLATTKVTTAADLSGNGHDIAQGTDADRPTIAATAGGYDAAVFTSGVEYLSVTDSLGATLNTEDAFLGTITILTEIDVLAVNQAFFSFGNTANAHVHWFGLDSANRLRSNRVGPGGTRTINTTAAAISSPGALAVTWSFKAGGLFDIFVNEALFQADMDWSGAAGTPAYNTFTLGCSRAATVGSGMQGKVAIWEIRA